MKASAITLSFGVHWNSVVAWSVLRPEVHFATVSVNSISLCTQMIDTVTGPGALPFAVQLKAMMDLEGRYQPKLSGLRLIETSQDNGLRMTTRLRELEVKDLLSLTRFFGFNSDTFSLAISLLDRFLSVMKVCKCSDSWNVHKLFYLFINICLRIKWCPLTFTDSTKASVLCGPVLLLYCSEVLRRGEECSSG